MSSLRERIAKSFDDTPCDWCVAFRVTSVLESMFTPAQLAYLEAHPDAKLAVLDVDQSTPSYDWESALQPGQSDMESKMIAMRFRKVVREQP